MRNEILIQLYKEGKTDKELSHFFNLHERTIRKKLANLRKKGIIDYRRFSASSKVLDKSKQSNDVTENELLKLFALYKTKSKISKILKTPISTISALCKEYGILDSEQISQNIIKCLREELDETEPYQVIKSKNSKGDTLVIQATDWHAGKKVQDEKGNFIFNEQIFKNRIDKLIASILNLLDNNIKKGVNITDVVILATGDLANGEGIYATQVYDQELAPPKQVILVVETFIKLIKALLDRKLNIKFYGVRGNHGRTGKDTDPSSNWDLMIYMILDMWNRHINKIKNIEVNYTEVDYMTVTIRGWRYLIRHIAPEQGETPASRVKFNEWARQHDIDAIVYGHYHHFGYYDVDSIRVFRGGSVVGQDDLSELMAKQSDPIQLIWGVNNTRVASFLYAVDLASK